MRCVKHNKLICFSRECRGENRWMARPAPRVPVPRPAAPQAGRRRGLAPDGETLGVPVVPVYQAGGQQRSPVRKAAPSARPGGRRIAGDDLNSLTNPVSPLHQAAYGGAFYGTADAPDRCTPPTSDRGTSSGSSSSTGYDGGSSSSGGYSSSSDSGSSSGSSSSCD